MLALVVGTIVGWIFFDPLLDQIMQPYCAMPNSMVIGVDPGDCRLLVLRPLEQFSVRIKTSLVVGLFVGGPVIFYQLWRFITPGLTRHERRLALPFVVSSQVMFAVGIAFSWLILPQALRVLLGIGGDNFVNALTGTEYLSFFLRTSIAFGLVFEIPLVLIFLALIGVVTNAGLRKARAWAIVGNVTVAALVTPTTDGVTLLFMAGPMLVFYEIAVLASWLIERNRRRQRP